MWDLREVHALYDGNGWVWNESFHFKNVFIGEVESPKEVFWQECQMLYFENFLRKCEVVDDGEILELQIKETGEPIWAMNFVE